MSKTHDWVIATPNPILSNISGTTLCFRNGMGQSSQCPVLSVRRRKMPLAAFLAISKDRDCSMAFADAVKAGEHSCNLSELR
ncbi:MAG: hypothetical protein AAGJ40_10735 [Planctomycetota bacterium]